MYFEFESIQSSMSSSPNDSSMVSSMSPMSGLSRRHRRLSSSTQSLRDLIDSENVIENISPSHCDLYLITRKKLSQMTTNTVKQNQDLRREVLLTSIHRNITSKSSLNQLMATNEFTTTSTDTSMATNRDKSQLNDSQLSQQSQQQMSTNCDQQFKFCSQSSTTTTSTTTMANTSSATRMISTSTTMATPSALKKRNLTPTSVPYSEYDSEWTTTIKRLKVVHGLDANWMDVSMDSEFDSGYCDTDLNDLTNNFHSLKTPFT